MIHKLSVRLALMIVGLSTGHAVLAGDKAAASRWEDSRHMYPVSPLCLRDEVTLWSCVSKAKAYSLCSSQDVSKNSGYMQYRVSDGQKLIFSFPEDKRPPKGVFEYDLAPSGNASVSFRNGDYSYTVYDPLREGAAISVTKAPANKAVGHVFCQESYQSLQLNYTMELMERSGLRSD